MNEKLEKKKTSKWALGCGIGCGVIILLIVLVVAGGYYLIKDTITAFEETSETMERLVKLHGEAKDYCPNPDGTINAPRMEAFLKVRESLTPMLDEMNKELELFISKIERSHKENDESMMTVVSISRSVLKIIPRLGKYYTYRNKKLIEVDMGLGEYFYIYSLAYYSYLGKSPNDGPDLSFFEKHQKSGGFDISNIRAEKEPGQNRHSKEAKEKRKRKFYSHVGRIILTLMQNQLEKLNQTTTTAEQDGWLKTLTEEVAAMEKDPTRLPWKDGLPEVLENSMKDFKKRLEQSYRAVLNPIELTVSTHH
ncbi:MAG: hypothetical protein GY757_45725 [bacterium]|nr:hypothetical protein [bacterium]